MEGEYIVKYYMSSHARKREGNRHQHDLCHLIITVTVDTSSSPARIPTRHHDLYLFPHPPHPFHPLHPFILPILIVSFLVTPHQSCHPNATQHLVNKLGRAKFVFCGVLACSGSHCISFSLGLQLSPNGVIEKKRAKTSVGHLLGEISALICLDYAYCVTWADVHLVIFHQYSSEGSDIHEPVIYVIWERSEDGSYPNNWPILHHVMTNMPTLYDACCDISYDDLPRIIRSSE